MKIRNKNIVIKTFSFATIHTERTILLKYLKIRYRSENNFAGPSK